MKTAAATHEWLIPIFKTTWHIQFLLWISLFTLFITQLSTILAPFTLLFQTVGRSSPTGDVHHDTSRCLHHSLRIFLQVRTNCVADFNWRTDDYRIGTDTRCIESYRLLLYRAKPNITCMTAYHPPRDRAVLRLGHQRQMTPHPLHQQELITTVSMSITLTFPRINQS